MGNIEEGKGVVETYMKILPEESGFKDDIRTLMEIEQYNKVIKNAVDNKDYRQATYQTT
jgi:hypothetical protein